ncbi:hypothetical protein PAPYR_12303 [Paratrimastix pyriformis]|uniref:THO complex subunitTHOC2 C-terminal domain-containing protein n=1 Tax=Paratrimastix pyriformis TaxID=342808 RepID=A0ABQ8U8X3_9EUKA|nr:hypothetical protein PAPYR_12303 [Paratrimastix pyriformis]
MSNYLNYHLASCTEKQANRMGLFLERFFTHVSPLFTGDRVLLQKYQPDVFLRSYLVYDKKNAQVFLSFLSSGDFILIRNALFVLSRAHQFLPAFQGSNVDLQSKATELADPDEHKSSERREDIKLLARRYLALLQQPRLLPDYNTVRRTYSLATPPVSTPPAASPAATPIKSTPARAGAVSPPVTTGASAGHKLVMPPGTGTGTTAKPTPRVEATKPTPTIAAGAAVGSNNNLHNSRSCPSRPIHQTTCCRSPDHSAINININININISSLRNLNDSNNNNYQGPANHCTRHHRHYNHHYHHHPPPPVLLAFTVPAAGPAPGFTTPRPLCAPCAPGCKRWFNRDAFSGPGHTAPQGRVGHTQGCKSGSGS